MLLLSMLLQRYYRGLLWVVFSFVFGGVLRDPAEAVVGRFVVLLCLDIVTPPFYTKPI